MKVLLVNKFHYLKGGSEKYYFELGKLLKEHGNEVAYFSMNDERNIKTGEKEYFVDPVDLNNGSKLKALDVIYSRANYKKMCEAIDDFKPDIIHLNNFQRQLSSSVAIAAFDKKIPVVFLTHDMQAVCPNKDMMYKGEICNDCIKYGYNSCIKNKCIKNSKLKSLLGVMEAKYYKKNKIYERMNCIISPSNFMKENLKKNGLKNNNFIVLHNFVNESNTKKLKDDNYILYFGRLSREKGIYNLLKAISNLKDVNLKIAGDGPEKENVIKFINKKEINDRVEILGYLNSNEIKIHISKCSFVVVPSIWYENCPYSILETIEIGKPVIASKIGGIPELIDDNETGMLYKYDDCNELKEKIEKLYQDKKLRESMGKKARKKFENEFSNESYYKNITNIYMQIIGEKNV